MYLMVGGSNTTSINYIDEKNYSIVPDNIDIWNGDIPWGSGDIFPTKVIEERASKYKTYTELYNNNYGEVFNAIYNINSMANDPMSYTQIYNLSLNIPDFKNCTESWVDLMASVPPRIDGESDDVDKVSSLLVNSRFNNQFKEIIRDNIRYGNKVIMVVKRGDGEVSFVNMRLTNWIPFVDEVDYEYIRSNVFYNIVTIDNRDICEFISYIDDGRIVKKVYTYNRSSKRLGELISEEESESFLGESPIVVFKDNNGSSGPLGMSLYPCWESAIASSIRSYNNTLTMLEKAKDAILVAPDTIGETDGNTDQRMLVRRGAIEYAQGTDHDVEWVTADVDLEAAIKTYRQTLNRLSRDTNLSLMFFDTTDISSINSARALKTIMFSTDQRAMSIVTSYEYDLKRLVVKFAKACGIDISLHDFSIIINVGLFNDDETQLNIIQARCGGAVTMSREDAIAAYDKVSIRRARDKIREIDGKEIDSNNNNIDIEIPGGGDDVGLTAVSTSGDEGDTGNRGKDGVVFVL